MNCYIKAIVLLGKDTTKRVVRLQQGVNIITGDSKTGKSALVEIIDYCLCATHCSVPKGIITEYTSIYSLLLHIDNAAYCIGRQAQSEGGKMYFSGVGNDFTDEQISHDYFSGMTPSPVKEVQQMIETALGMTITNLKGLDEQGKKVELIQKQTGIIPQLIVVDHVSNEFLDQKERFDAALRCEWRNGKKLI